MSKYSHKLPPSPTEHKPIICLPQISQFGFSVHLCRSPKARLPKSTYPFFPPGTQPVLDQPALQSATPQNDTPAVSCNPTSSDRRFIYINPHTWLGLPRHMIVASFPITGPVVVEYWKSTNRRGAHVRKFDPLRDECRHDSSCESGACLC